MDVPGEMAGELTDGLARIFVFIVDIYLKAFWDKCFEDGAHIFGREYAGRRFGRGGFTRPCIGV